ncbi:hypothetical protein YC2023_085851 [Brassica napus]
MFKETKFLRPDREKRWPESMLYDISSTDNRLRAEILAGMKPSNEFQLKFKAMSRFSMSKSSSGMVPREVVTAEIKKLKIHIEENMVLTYRMYFKLSITASEHGIDKRNIADKKQTLYINTNKNDLYISHHTVNSGY